MIGFQELFLLLLILLLIFGGRKLPELARSLGRAKKEFGEGAIEDSIRIRKIAQNLGIPTEGKTDEQLLREIEALGKISIESGP
ncbi:MAG: twin-arginine translocase TatA/TatE family subunit [Candidatus Hydrothermarchaeota archaeon]|nr:twin-arginine translocase TatA/TatE family subunit [Candidatus Hydrothermarchaeota archaeon]